MNADLILVLVLLTNMRLLGSSRLGACIRTTAAQGILLGLLPLLAPGHPAMWRSLVIGSGVIALKGFVFPWLLFRALREAAVTREVEPYVGYINSLLIGLAALAAAFWIGGRLPLPVPGVSPLMVPVSFFSIFAGLFLIVSRKRAMNQVLGFLVLENGIYAFGASVAGETSVLVEAGMLLDVFVAVFVMGIAIFHINREFDHIEADRLSTLKD